MRKMEIFVPNPEQNVTEMAAEIVTQFGLVSDLHANYRACDHP